MLAGASRRLEFYRRAAGVHQRFVHPEAVSYAAHVNRSPYGFLLFMCVVSAQLHNPAFHLCYLLPVYTPYLLTRSY